MTFQLPETVRIHHATKTKAEKLASMFENEYPALTLEFDTNEDVSAVTAWIVTHGEDRNVILSAEKVPDLAKVLEICEDEGLDPEEGAEDEEDRGGSIVPQKYREEYAARGNPANCGDWLAHFCEEQCHIPNAKGKATFSISDFEELLNANGVPLDGKWAQARFTARPGWQGRFRMSGRQQLEKYVALRGTAKALNGADVAVPDEELAALRNKHEKWLGKQQQTA